MTRNNSEFRQKYEHIFISFHNKKLAIIPGSGSTDKDDVLLFFDKITFGQTKDQRAVFLPGLMEFEIEIVWQEFVK